MNRRKIKGEIKQLSEQIREAAMRKKMQKPQEDDYFNRFFERLEETESYEAAMEGLPDEMQKVLVEYRDVVEEAVLREVEREKARARQTQSDG